MNTKRIEELSSGIAGETVNLRRQLHQYPELGFKEFKTSTLIRKHLEQLGFEVKTDIARTGLSGLLKGDKPGKTVAIRADMDALPIVEQNISEYKSRQEGIMHACGHDAHVAIALGTAKVLSNMKSEINGCVKFIFQPGEEGLGGAKFMIDEGVLDSPKVNTIIATHVSPLLEAGQISIGSGPVMASPSEFEITIIGKGGHAAQPQETIDPIFIGANLINMLQGIITREKNPVYPAVLSITGFHSGGSYNIIPDRAVLMGTVRTFDPGLDKSISEKMEEITEAITKAMGADYEFDYKVGYPPVINHALIAEKIAESAKKILPGKNVIVNPGPSMLAEDFAYYTGKVPGAMYFLGCGNVKKGIIHNLHSSNFDIDEGCLEIGIKIMTQCVLDLLSD